MKQIKKILMVADANVSRISWTKVGVAICAVVGAIVSAGVCPVAYLPVAKAILSIGAGIGLIGARDALVK